MCHISPTLCSSAFGSPPPSVCLTLTRPSWPPSGPSQSPCSSLALDASAGPAALALPTASPTATGQVMTLFCLHTPGGIVTHEGLHLRSRMNEGASERVGANRPGRPPGQWCLFRLNDLQSDPSVSGSRAPRLLLLPSVLHTGVGAQHPLSKTEPPLPQPVSPPLCLAHPDPLPRRRPAQRCPLPPPLIRQLTSSVDLTSVNPPQQSSSTRRLVPTRPDPLRGSWLR